MKEMMQRKIIGPVLLAILIVLPKGAHPIDFSSHGYYRNRVNFTYNLDTQSKGPEEQNNDRFGMISWNQMRLRLEPVLKLNDFLVIQAQFDILDNLLYGTKNTKQIAIDSPVVGTISLPAGAGSISMVGGAAGENGSINVRRVWGEIFTPVGLLRIGRQPSHWGLGIFQNDGNNPDADFGDTADRILFMTQKEFGDGSAFSFGALWDIAYEAQLDPRTEGLGGIIRDNGQDTNQWAGIISYERPEFEIGVFGGVRKRDGGHGTTTEVYAFDNGTGTLKTEKTRAGRDGDTFIHFVDAYGKVRYREYNLGAEFVYLGGKMSTGVALDAIPLAAQMPAHKNVYGEDIDGVIELPPEQKVNIIMAAFEAGAHYSWGGEWSLKAGYASGDPTPLSYRITQYGFRPDYQIGLLLFHYPLGTSAPMIPQGGNYKGQVVAGHLPITGNFINNAIYAAATYKHHFDLEKSCKPCNDLSVGLRLATAWADKPPLDMDFGDLLGDPTYPEVKSKGKWYGLECDLMFEGRFYDYLKAIFETGVLIPGAAYNISTDVIDPKGILSPIFPDKANLAYAGRFTLSFEF